MFARVSPRGGGLSVVLTALVTTAALAASARAAPPTGPPSELFPSEGAYLGARVEGAAGVPATEAVLALERMMGRPLAVERIYHRWWDAFPTEEDVRSADEGHLLFLSWTPLTARGAVTPWSAIASGRYDTWIRSRADAVRAFGRPMYLSFNHEPEDDAAYGTPSDFVAAYRHVVDVFRQEGVSNVGFVCTFMSSSFEDGEARAASFYPGNAYVDAIGVDAYNWYPGKPGSHWRSFEDIVAPAHRFALDRDRPLVVPEFGVQEDPASPGRKAAWLGAAARTIRSWPDVKAVMYFDVDKVYAWQLSSSPLSVAAFAAIGSQPGLDDLPPFDHVAAAIGISATAR